MLRSPLILAVTVCFSVMVKSQVINTDDSAIYPYPYSNFYPNFIPYAPDVSFSPQIPYSPYICTQPSCLLPPSSYCVCNCRIEEVEESSEGVGGAVSGLLGSVLGAL